MIVNTPMMKLINRVTGAVSNTVSLGNGTYADTVVVTGTGDIAPVAPSAAGVYAGPGVSLAKLGNLGTIQGAAAANGTNISGGDGVFLATTGTVNNRGLIGGGAGATNANGIGSSGGSGIQFTGNGTVHNGGTIYGGAGGVSTAAEYLGGTGGVGVVLGDGGKLGNRGLIQGGQGGASSPYGTGGNGGIGIEITGGGTIGNTGTILGGDGAANTHFAAGAGGTGIVAANDVLLVNTGLIAGGAGGTGAYEYGTGGRGGLGVSLGNDDTVVNIGTIQGGTGGNYGSSDYGYGGTGLYAVGYDTILNKGVILGGGCGTLVGYQANGGGAGLAIGYPGHVSLTNTGIIEGGQGGTANVEAGIGGIGVLLAFGTANIINAGTILGGAGGDVLSGTGDGYTYAGKGGAGIYIFSGSILNAGLVEGGQGGSNGVNGGYGGTGIDASNGVDITNTGTILGGNGGPPGPLTSGNGEGVGGGYGLALTGTLINTGTIRGGSGTYQTGTGSAGRGGGGIAFNSGYIANGGLIIGGNGGNGYNDANGGNGISLSDGFCTIFNKGTISGGNGGLSTSDYRSRGGAGIILGTGLLINTGLVTGGKGGSTTSLATGYQGGVGIIATFGTIVNAGTISGGAGGMGGGGQGSLGTAVALYNSAELVVDPGAVFIGQVTASEGNTLLLAGTTAGTLSGLGVQFTGFGAITELAGATWTLTNAYNISNILTAYGQLSLNGSLSGNGTITAYGGSTVNLNGGGYFAGLINGAGTVELTNATTLTAGAVINAADLVITSLLSLGLGEDLTNAAGNIFALDSTAPDTPAADIIEGHRANPQIDGAGNNLFTNDGSFTVDVSSSATVGVSFSNDGSVAVSSGMLDFTGTLTGTGGFYGAAGTELAITGGAYLSGSITSAGTVMVASDTTLMTGASLSATTVVDTTMLNLETGVSLTVGAGDSFSLDGSTAGAYVFGHRANPQVTGAYGDSFTNFGTLMSSGTGVNTVGVTFDSTGMVEASSGTLDFTGTVTASGMIMADAGAQIDFAAGANLYGTLTGAGYVDFTAATMLNTGASLSVANVTDTSTLTLGTGVNLDNGAGGTFMLGAAATPGATAGVYFGHRANPQITGATGDGFSNAGTLDQVGPGTADVSVSFTNTGQVFSSAGTLAFLGPVTNNGTMDVTAGRLSLATDVTGTGALQIGASGTLLLLEGAGSGQTVAFTAGAGLLDLEMASTFAGTITGFGGSDVIDLIHGKSTSFTFSGDVLTVKFGRAVIATLNFGSGYAQSDFAVTSDGHNGSFINFV